MLKFTFCELLKRKHVSKDMISNSTVDYTTETKIKSNGNIEINCLYLCKYCNKSILMEI